MIYCAATTLDLKAIFWSSEETLSSVPFVPDDRSKADSYCSTIYIISNATIEQVHSCVTNTVNIRFSLNPRSHKSNTPDLQDVTSPPLGPGALFGRTEGFQDRKSSLFQTERQNGACLYLREVIPLIYKTPKQGFLPPYFPGAVPFKRA